MFPLVAVFPVIPSVVYAVVRALFYNTNCWVTPIEAYEWVLNAPCLISLVVTIQIQSHPYPSR